MPLSLGLNEVTAFGDPEVQGVPSKLKPHCTVDCCQLVVGLASRDWHLPLATALVRAWDACFCWRLLGLVHVVRWEAFGGVDLLVKPSG